MSDFRSRFLIGVTAMVVLLVVTLGLQGCQQYGTVSPKTYEIATALYAICNRQDDARLPVVERLIAESAAADQLSHTEQSWLQDIVAAAKAGKWEESMIDARTMLAEQVTR